MPLPPHADRPAARPAAITTAIIIGIIRFEKFFISFSILPISSRLRSSFHHVCGRSIAALAAICQAFIIRHDLPATAIPSLCCMRMTCHHRSATIASTGCLLQASATGLLSNSCKICPRQLHRLATLSSSSYPPQASHYQSGHADRRSLYVTGVWLTIPGYPGTNLASVFQAFIILHDLCASGVPPLEIPQRLTLSAQRRCPTNLRWLYRCSAHCCLPSTPHQNSHADLYILLIAGSLLAPCTHLPCSPHRPAAFFPPASPLLSGSRNEKQLPSPGTLCART